ncbi:hypothetical protein EST35_0456 [Pseudomonas phage vB_PaeM_PA5oct]|uniref:Uncharacterized protein n=1 Tax=Pseudomonas phage vB_PaeM_PA5oct TaxID=2163605 RepID=A0A4Y5JUQ4_9CAUD|nr:hypothetical protein PQE65_gp041 [Pseudomonas phage vB_PaeM_PA5oct]QCG76324.1 hypothetical protein EST35_0456 [Pseudomonas phage vB_PaeM_PA5oct]
MIIHISHLTHIISVYSKYIIVINKTNEIILCPYTYNRTKIYINKLLLNIDLICYIQYKTETISYPVVITNFLLYPYLVNNTLVI